MRATRMNIRTSMSERRTKNEEQRTNVERRTQNGILEQFDVLRSTFRSVLCSVLSLVPHDSTA